MVAMNAIRKCFPEDTLKGCFFHLVQNMRKHLVRSGVAHDFNDVEWLWPWPFPDLEEYVAAVEEYLSGDMQPILNWYEVIYIGHPFRRRQGKQPSLFPIVIWTVFESMQGAEDCANNNWWLCAQLGMCHPTIWKFINGLREKINFMYSSFLDVAFH
uniref:MULE transposase domain-containing protein n=1 Tax=Micrurus paraensis TaxID=1970185 RepID=A0A2D4L816_9SAUR